MPGRLELKIGRIIQYGRLRRPIICRQHNCTGTRYYPQTTF